GVKGSADPTPWSVFTAFPGSLAEPSSKGRPLASVRKAFTRSKLGWLKPQQPAGPPLYGKFSTKSGFALLMVPVPAADWMAKIDSGLLSFDARKRSPK